MDEDESPDPLAVGLLRARAVVAGAKGLSELDKQIRLAGRDADADVTRRLVRRVGRFEAYCCGEHRSGPQKTSAK